MRDVRFVARLNCSTLDEGEFLAIHSVDVKHRVGLFEKEVVLLKRVGIGPGGARC